MISNETTDYLIPVKQQIKILEIARASILGGTIGLCAAINLGLLNELSFDLEPNQKRKYRETSFPDFIAMKPRRKDMKDYWWGTYNTSIRLAKLEILINNRLILLVNGSSGCNLDTGESKGDTQEQ